MTTANNYPTATPDYANGHSFTDYEVYYEESQTCDDVTIEVTHPNGEYGQLVIEYFEIHDGFLNQKIVEDWVADNLDKFNWYKD